MPAMLKIANWIQWWYDDDDNDDDYDVIDYDDDDNDDDANQAKARTLSSKRCQIAL